LVALPVLLVLVGLVEDVTLLLHLVVVDVEGALIDVQVGVFDLGSSVRGLKAHEGERRLVILLAEELEGLDLTVVREEVSEVFLGGLSREVLHVQVASLLRVLVLEGFMGQFLLAFALFEARRHIENLTTEFFVVHGLYSLGRASGSILTVGSIFGAVADEGESTNTILVAVE